MIKFVDHSGVIREQVPNACYDRVVEIGQALANKHKSTIRAYKGALTKLGTFRPEA